MKKKPSRWQRAAEPQWDDHDAVMVIGKNGRFRVTRLLQLKRFIVGPVR